MRCHGTKKLKVALPYETAMRFNYRVGWQLRTIEVLSCLSNCTVRAIEGHDLCIPQGHDFSHSEVAESKVYQVAAFT